MNKNNNSNIFSDPNNPGKWLRICPLCSKEVSCCSRNAASQADYKGTRCMDCVIRLRNDGKLLAGGHSFTQPKKQLIPGSKKSYYLDSYEGIAMFLNFTAKEIICPYCQKQDIISVPEFWNDITCRNCRKIINFN